MVQEPTAAAVYYAYESLKSNKAMPVYNLVFDFGGGTLDISIIQIQNGKFNVLATGGDYFLGGQDVDIALMKYLVEEYKKDNDGYDLMSGKPEIVDKTKAKLKKAAENTKILLSAQDQAETDCYIENLRNGEDFEKTVTLHVLDLCCKPLIENKIIPLLCKTI